MRILSGLVAIRLDPGFGQRSGQEAGRRGEDRLQERAKRRIEPQHARVQDPGRLGNGARHSKRTIDRFRDRVPETIIHPQGGKWSCGQTLPA